MREEENKTFFENRIREARVSFSPSFQKLAEFILDSYAHAALMTATELAHVLDLDPATVVRFAQKLDYNGYPELQRELRLKLKKEILRLPSKLDEENFTPADKAFTNAARSIELTRRSFSIQTAEKLIDILDVSERVILLAEGMAIPSAHSLSSWLKAAGYTVQRTGGNPIEMARVITGARPQDLAFAIEVTADTPFIARALEAARTAGLQTAALVAAPSSEIAVHADHVLAGHANPEPALRQIIVETMVFAFIQILRKSRPVRFDRSNERSLKLSRQIISGKLE